jgi:putative oxidoreductase
MNSSATFTTPRTRGKGMNISLWIGQVLLALMLGMAGVLKLTTPIAELAIKMGWVNAIPEALVRFIGFSEILAAIGLILPSMLRIQPRLTVYAALGLALIMVLAIPLHISRGEFSGLPINFVILAISVFIAWGRAKMAPIAPKNS